jgi:hypothetical protein
MSNRAKTRCLIAFCVAVSLFAGCLPGDSLQWNADGSKGLYSKNGGLYLVDGSTGALTKVADKETTASWPAISSDGSQIAYGEIVKVNDFDVALKKLPPSEVKTIESNAELLKQKILNEGIKDGNLPFIGESKDSFNEQHTAWVARYLVEKANNQVGQKIGAELTKKIKAGGLTYFQLILAHAADPNNKRMLATSHQQLWRINFSPDSRFVAYVTDRITGKAYEAGFNLYVVLPAEKTSAAFVASSVSIGYCFRPDSCAIAYLKPEDENIKDQKLVLGSLIEKTLVDPNGKFLVSSENNSYTCTGASKAYAGVLFDSWMKVSYAHGDRIFFSSSKITLPSGNTEQPKGSVFCCDTLTGGVSDIGQIGADFMKDNYYLFEPSHDSRKVLVPGNKNTLVVYVLGPDLESSKLIVDSNEGFGDDSPPKLLAEWKGANQFSCLVSEKSRYLTADPNNPHQRKEIVILDTEGKLVRILSKDWPDELLDY